MLECKAMTQATTQATISSKNQIVIPREAREALGVKPGDKLVVVVQGERVIVLKNPKSHRAAIRGLGQGVYPAGYLQKERESWD
jgi:AbrB family looped-hinge helix DNA binding protein